MNRNVNINGPKLVSLFSGCGGMDIGFEDAGFFRVWANDFDKFAVQTYKANRIDNETLNKMENLTFDDNTFMPIEKIEYNNQQMNNGIENQTTQTTPTTSMFVSELDKKEDVEFIDL